MPDDIRSVPPATHGRAKRAVELVRILDGLMILADVIAGVTLGYASVRLYFFAVSGSWGGQFALGPLWREMLLGSVIAALVLKERPFAATRQAGGLPDLVSLAQKSVIAVSILLAVGLATRSFDDMARLWLVTWLALFAVYVVASRLATIRYLGRLAEDGQLREAVAILGSAPDVANRMAARLSADVEVVTVIEDVDDYDEGGAVTLLSELQDLAGTGAIDTVILAMDAKGVAELPPLLERLKAVPVQVAICDDGAIVSPISQSVRMLGGLPMTVVADAPMTTWHLLQKELLDKIGAILLIVAMSPIMLAAAIAIMLEGPGPVIFRQTRKGWSGRPFTIYKFRTMRAAGDAATGGQTERRDQRCTRVGSFLRRTSMDELPQLWNVMCGEMSLVGPRPHAEHLHRNQRNGCQIVAEYAQRQRVKPGLTGWAQIHGARGAVSTPHQMRRRVQYDLYYIDHWSIWLDLSILARTPFSILSADNAF